MALSNSSPNRPPFAQLLGMLSLPAGGLVAAGGVVLAILLILGAQLRDSETGIGETALPQAVAVGVLGVYLGSLLIAEGIRRRRRLPSATFHPRRSGWLWMAFAILLVAGTVASLLDTPPPLMALFHGLTLLLLPALVLSLVGRGLRGRGVSWSDVNGGFLDPSFSRPGLSAGCGLRCGVRPGGEYAQQPLCRPHVGARSAGPPGGNGHALRYRRPDGLGVGPVVGRTAALAAPAGLRGRSDAPQPLELLRGRAGPDRSLGSGPD